MTWDVKIGVGCLPVQRIHSKRDQLSTLTHLPGSADASRLLPDAVAVPGGTGFGLEVFKGIAAVEMATFDEGLTVLDHGQADIDLADHFRHGASIAVTIDGSQLHLTTRRQAGFEIAARHGSPGSLLQFRCIDTCQPHLDLPAALLHQQAVAISNPQNRGNVGRSAQDN